MQQKRIQQTKERMSDLRDSLTGRLDGEAIGEQGQKALERVEGIPSNLYLLGVFGSIALSAGLFIAARRAWALFVGLWPPTIVSFAIAAKQLRPSQELAALRKAA